MTTEQTRDALAQLEAVLELAEKASVGVREFAMPKVDAEFFAAALPFIRQHAETLRALLGAADGVKTTFCVDCGQHVTGPCGRGDLCNVPEQYPLPEFGSESPLDTFPTLTKAPAND